LQEKIFTVLPTDSSVITVLGGVRLIVNIKIKESLNSYNLLRSTLAYAYLRTFICCKKWLRLEGGQQRQEMWM